MTADRTREDIAQDRRIADLARDVEAAEQNIRTLTASLATARSSIDVLAKRLEPLEGLADQIKKIQDFFASLGAK